MTDIIRKAFNLEFPTITALGLAMSFALSLAAVPAHAEEELIGSEEFRTACQVCHGVGGSGNGPMSSYLTVAPSDLTSLAANNDGVFPFLKVFHMIDGRTGKDIAVAPAVGAHGIREMPVWGSRYKAESGDKYGPYGGEQAARARVLELVYYIQAIQQ